MMQELLPHAPPNTAAAKNNSRYRPVAFKSRVAPISKPDYSGPVPTFRTRAGQHRQHWHLATEEGLINAAIAGKREAFSEIVRRYQSRLYASAFKLARSHEFAEDIVQETWIKAFSKLHTFRFQSGIYSWLFRIAFNQFLASRRKRNIPTEYFEETSYSDTGEPLDKSPSAEQLLLQWEDKERVRVAFSQLDSQSRQILELREMQGHSYQQLSEELKLNIGTVRSRLSRARSKLGRLLRDDRTLL